ncbi:UDP-glucose--hexose-1-phosphate uridylyltransferase [Limosilactobacillus equigenerosi]|uniref:Galactose-1-phosphate uridylyltransferase n=1 Tax=Limosilactobacillus equigenerosi DSM 18793 = JCM 14505 TaxID=1423742 RepID=A0A0R1UW28_9LACO|nr:UDP-glucose--hexose-1-phosphate uridylyltransferase [Limosilactobacillus equigenerosi]KRL95093.1 Galactose-1-phosphate uridylyltransferase [Limosilactobacillus equigenerosi DSM 18793 = JCM 14505]
MGVISDFCDQVIASGRYQELDRNYVMNQLRALVGDEDVPTQAGKLVSQLVDLSISREKIEDSITERTILSDQLYDFLAPLPAQVNEHFWNLAQVSPQQATDWFYDLETKTDYVKADAIKKNIEFTRTVADGNELEITINLSKPEKDPKAIVAAAHAAANQYPKCALCMENEGYRGRLGYASRTNHRIIRMNIGGETWGFQYSPYAYFNEHCIFLLGEHQPMKINQQTLVNLVEIERQLPHYFVGSNADLPIVGGSMLAHEHYQGGRHTFPMMKAPIKQAVDFPAYPQVTAGIVDWPMSDLRLQSTDTTALINLGTHIMTTWQNYSDPMLMIDAGDGEERHHTVTPIMHRQGDLFVLDLVLRDNSTNEQYPLGIFHPHEQLWHIKKENIGLIEVMGRAILPGRLKAELAEVKRYWLGETNEIAASHLSWAKEVQSQTTITPTNVDEVLEQAVAQVFSDVLADAGVFKRDDEGAAGWQRFIEQL